MLDDLQLDQITDPQAREVIQRLLNLVEALSAEEVVRAEHGPDLPG